MVGRSEFHYNHLQHQFFYEERVEGGDGAGMMEDGERAHSSPPKLTFRLTSLWEVVAQLVEAPTQRLDPDILGLCCNLPSYLKTYCRLFSLQQIL